MPTPSPRARSVERRLRAALTDRMGIKLAALFFAFILWLLVSAEEPTDEWVNVDLRLLTDSTVTLLGRSPHVQALVIGRGRELLKLYNAPPTIRRAISADTAAVQTLELHAGDVDLPTGVDARVRDVRPHVLLVHLERRPREERGTENTRAVP